MPSGDCGLPVEGSATQLRRICTLLEESLTLSSGKDAPPPGSGYNREDSEAPEGVFFGASMVTQRLKHLPAMQESWVRSLGWEDPLEKKMATHSSILAWRIP